MSKPSEDQSALLDEPSAPAAPAATRDVKLASRPQWSPPSAGLRGTIDALVQGALVELFHAYGVALAPMPRSPIRDVLAFHEVAVSIAFSRSASDRASADYGRLILSMPQGVFALVKGAEVRSSDDWARELVNQLMGRIKNRLLPFGVTLQTGLPATADPVLEGQRLRSSSRIYTGRTLRGEVLIAIEGLPDESQLSYVGLVNVASEGDTLFF
jgi:hypothetical protein